MSEDLNGTCGECYIKPGEICDICGKSRPQAAEPEAAFDAMIADAKRAALVAMQRYPAPNYTITKFAEEAGEVVKAAVHCAENRETFENLIGEITQAVAMIYRLYHEGDGVHGLQPLAQKAASA